MNLVMSARRPARLLRVGIAVAAAGLTAGVVATPASAAPGATVNVVHGIPGATVKVCVDGKAVADNFRYGNKIVGAVLAPKAHRVRVVEAGESCRTTPILKSRYDLEAGRNYTIVANLNPGGSANLKAFVNRVGPTAAGKARLTVRHTAQAPAVNVWAGETKLIRGNGFVWGEGSTFPVSAGTYSVKVTLPGSAQAVIGPADKSLTAGRAYQVYAVGSSGHYRLVTIKVRTGTTGQR